MVECVERIASLQQQCNVSSEVRRGVLATHHFVQVVTPPGRITLVHSMHSHRSSKSRSRATSLRALSARVSAGGFSVSGFARLSEVFLVVLTLLLKRCRVF